MLQLISTGVTFICMGIAALISPGLYTVALSIANSETACIKERNYDLKV